MAGGKTVLIVDDDASIRMLIRHVLENAGFQVIGEAENGAEGVERARELRPDIITMDLEMPVMDGATAASHICANGDCPPIVIVSGSVSSAHVGAALSAGARWHVAKRDLVAQLPNVAIALAG